MNQREIYELVQDDLTETEKELARYASSNIHLIDQIGRYVMASGGKRIRPALLLLASRVCGFEGAVCHRFAAVVELLHAATLVHDDIIDDAKVRRGMASVNARWGNEITVLMGDWLYMTSFNVVLGERRFPIMDILMDVTRKMVEGELIQLSINGSPDITEQQHLDILMRKTAFLFSACAEIGAILGSATSEQQKALKGYGLNVGIAFQIVDDVLDFTSTESALGKPVGSDLQEGKLTLPLIFLMRDATPEHRDLIRAALREDSCRQEGKETILRLLREYGSVEQVLEKARQFTDGARRELSVFPDSPARQALLAVPDYIMKRDR